MEHDNRSRGKYGIRTVDLPDVRLWIYKSAFSRSWNLFFIVIKHNHDSRDRYANSALYRLLSS